MSANLSAFSLEGKTAVLIGGAGALGSAISRGLGEAGARLAVCDISEEKAASAVTQLEGDGLDARGYEIDAMDKVSIASGCEAILHDLERVDILVNLAGGNATFNGSVGSYCVKIFDLAIASSGLNLQVALKEGFDAIQALVIQSDRAHFYPTQDLMYLQLVVDRKTRRVLGMQGISHNGDDFIIIFIFGFGPRI